MSEERYVGGLYCTEVLALLGDYVDESVTETQKRAIEAHVAGCTWCARFGGQYAELVTTLRTHVRATAQPGTDSFAARVRAALDAES